MFPRRRNGLIPAYACLATLLTGASANAVDQLMVPGPAAGGSTCSSNQIIVRLRRPVHDRVERAQRINVRKVDQDALPHLGAAARTEARRWQALKIRPLYTEEFSRPDLARKYGLDRTYVVEVPPGTDTPAMVHAFGRLADEIEDASVDTLGGVADEFIPNDTFFNVQWALRNVGQLIGTCSGGLNQGKACNTIAQCPRLCVGGLNAGDVCFGVVDCPRSCVGGANNGEPCSSGADCTNGNCPSTTCPSTTCTGKAGLNDKDIDATEAWDIYDGLDGDVTVAIVDSGVAPHSEWGDRLLPGRNTYDLGNPTLTTDQCGHGTHVAGIVAAAGNNALGVAGVNWGVKILPIRILGPNLFGQCGQGTVASLANGIIWAADNGADIANFSLQYYLDSSESDRNTVQNAVNYATESGMLLIAATGNNVGEVVAFPGKSRNTLAVGGTNGRDMRAMPTNDGWQSNYGPEIDLMAPGDRIHSTALNNGFLYLSGTSMATPHVAGLASLLKAYNPSFTRQDLMDLLILAAEDLGDSGWDIEYGYGRINAFGAMTAASSFPVIMNSMPANYAIDAGQPTDNLAFFTYGYQQIAMDLPAEVVASISKDSFRVLQKGGSPASIPVVTETTISDVGAVIAHFDVPVQPLTWTTLVLQGSGAVTLGFLPADVNASQTSNAEDVSTLVASLEADLVEPPDPGQSLPLWSADLDRSGMKSPLDVLTCLDLLNGADAHDRYINKTLP